MEVYVIRHGQSTANAIRSHAGWAQVPLTEKGMEQARQLRPLLQDIPFTKVITSDLLRAIQTAQGALPGYEAQTDPRLREINVGSLEGRIIEDCHAEMGAVYARNLADHDFTAYGGETMAQQIQRVAQFMESLQSEPEDAKVAVVCHEGTIYSMLCHVLQFTPARDAAPVSNCAICAFSYQDGRWMLRKWNETGAAAITP